MTTQILTQNETVNRVYNVTKSIVTGIAVVAVPALVMLLA